MIAEACAIAQRGLRVCWTHTIGPDGKCTCGRSDEPHKPCDPRTWGKHPIFKAWQKTATDDEQALRDQYAELRCVPNVSVVLGVQSDGRYLVSVDDDDPERMAELVAEHGPLPATLTGRSPRGAHLFFVLSPDTPRERVKNITGVGGEPGVDLKAAGGQVVVVGRNAGGEYTGFDPSQPIAELPPGWTLAILAPPKPPPDVHTYTPQTLREDAKAKRRYQTYLDRAVASECSLLARTGEGQRNSATYQAAFKLLSLANGMHLPAAWGHVRDEVERASVASGLSVGEARATVGSAERGVLDSGAVRMPREAPSPASTRPASSRPPEAEGDAHDIDPPSTVLIEINGSPAKIAENVARMLALYPRGAPRFNTFANRVVWPDGAEVSDTDEMILQGWLSEQPHAMRVACGVDVVHGGVVLAASRSPYHPVQEYLSGLTWDGVPRISTFGTTCLSAPDSPYVSAVIRCFFLGCVARAMRPGCQLDTMMILEGAQGVRKTTALRTLAGPEWFSCTTIDLRKSPDKYQQLDGVWIYELGEFDAHARASDQGEIKAYISTREDRYRPSYGRNTITRLRGVAFAGSTNATTYLADETGGRRFHPVLCGAVNVEAIARDRDQLWAEAMVAFTAGENWWLSSELEAVAASEVDARYHGDTWEETLPRLLVAHESITTSAALLLLGVETAKQGRADSMRVGAALRRIGWVRQRRREGVSRAYEYVKRGSRWDQ